MPEHTRKILLDAVTLSNFALIDCLGLIISRYGKRAALTTEVLDEIYDGINTGLYQLQSIANAVHNRELGLSHLSARERKVYGKTLHNLSPGEASCIASAQICNGVVATDDRAARTCCRERDIATTCTIGILVACTREGAITPDQADLSLQEMIEQGFYSPVNRISDILN